MSLKSSGFGCLTNLSASETIEVTIPGFTFDLLLSEAAEMKPEATNGDETAPSTLMKKLMGTVQNPSLSFASSRPHYAWSKGSSSVASNFRSSCNCGNVHLESNIKMLEAAMQRLTNLCSVLNDMEPICVLNHVFVLKEYMRECILGNFRRRLLGVLKTDNDLQRPSVLESLIQRHVSIVHLAEQHISMDITQSIREVLLSEAFSGPVSSLHLFEKPTDQHTGSATKSVCNWYIENIIKDVSGAGILFVPIHKCFRSTRPVGGHFAESVIDLRELKAFVRIFGGYGVDRLDRTLKEHTAALTPHCGQIMMC